MRPALSATCRTLFFDRNQIPRALADLQEAGIEEPNEDRAGEPIVWVKKEDLQRAKGLLKKHNFRAAHKPWD